MSSGSRPLSPTSSVSSYSSYLNQSLSFTSTGGTPPGKSRSLRRASSSILKESVASQFSHQLRELRNRIDATTPHYVRCLKPNDDLVPHQFEPHIIADQLRCAGVLEAIRVSRVGFPNRYFHEQFLTRYSILANPKARSRFTGKDKCVNLINALTPQVVSVLERDGDTSETNARK